ncbi:MULTISPECIES: phage major capsid protein [unclassified Paenibacillus]|uniref:phage major capsid protein n=1 Tax=unclassified Paenibacillus TaxID=185978 RepID=UPI00095528E8|nr:MULTISPECIES: phage major capsid protein [unclassified Paenibacillus]ASS66382.1 phage major capsid protein [Paenibacillus sp. RUD330]SIQ06149.1 phage major capsid protein, HK97 family [Paenibacillus sp. RU4X]SIQ26283.1 phage major capsid protein, HK97 family [Paenibacillus sp. RU4T]
MGKLLKKINERKQQLHEKRTQAEKLAGEDKLEELRSLTAEIRTVKEEIETLEELDRLEDPEPKPPASPVDPVATPAEARNLHRVNELVKSDEYRAAFLANLRRAAGRDDYRILKEARSLSALTGADGGFLVPKDIDTEIIRLKRDLPKLEELCRVIPVKSLSGTRNIETGANYTKFVKVGELQPMPELQSPKFAQISYAITDKAGFMQIPNDLLQDGDDAEIMAYIAEWVARGVVGTRNDEILTMLAAIANPVAVAGLPDLKKIMNISLDPAIAQSSSVITNQDGFNVLDNWTDGQGRPLLQPDPTQPTNKLLLGKPVRVVSNAILPTTGTTTKKAPAYIGSYADYIAIFERAGYRIDTTQEGGNAWRNNSTEARAIYRDDMKTIDATAVVNGQITVP